MLNTVILMGRLCADPERKTTQSGVSVCRIRIAVNRAYDKGEQKADFIQIVCWRKQAEFVNQYFHKGSTIIVEGRLQNADYTDQNGVKHYAMEVQANNVMFGETKTASQNHQEGAQQPFGNNPPQIQTDDIAQQNAYDAVGDLNSFEEILSDGDVPF